MSIEDVVEQLRRLDPAGCAGYCSHAGSHDVWPSVVWRTDCGSVGHLVISVHPQDIDDVVVVLREYQDGAANATGAASWAYDPADRLFDAGVRCEWHV